MNDLILNSDLDLLLSRNLASQSSLKTKHNRRKRAAHSLKESLEKRINRTYRDYQRESGQCSDFLLINTPGNKRTETYKG